MIDCNWQEYLLQVTTKHGAYLLEYATQEEFYTRILTTQDSNPVRNHIYSVIPLTEEAFALLESYLRSEDYIIRGET